MGREYLDLCNTTLGLCLRQDDRPDPTANMFRFTEEEKGMPARKKLRLTSEQSTVLEERFNAQNSLNSLQKEDLAKKLGLLPRQIEVWFQNRRARTKLKQTEVNCEALKRWCENLRIENSRLKKEVQELRLCGGNPIAERIMRPDEEKRPLSSLSM